jgi:hypothetical protein
MPRCEFDAYLRRNARQNEGANAQRLQAQIKRRIDEEGRLAFFQNDMVRRRRKTGEKLRIRAAGLHGRLQLRRMIDALFFHQEEPEVR